MLDVQMETENNLVVSGFSYLYSPTYLPNINVLRTCSIILNLLVDICHSSHLSLH